MWIAIVATVVAVIGVVVVSRHRRLGRPSDLGSVSEQWMAEHRAGQLENRLR